MSQSPTSPADQGEEGIEEQTQLQEPASASGESFNDSIGKSLLEAFGVSDDLGEAEQPEAQPSDEDDAEPPEPVASTATTDAPPSLEEQIPRWVEQVAGNPKSINQIPAKHHPAVMEALVSRNATIQQRAIQEASQAGEQRALQRIQAEQRQQATVAAVAEIDQLKAEDRDGYVDWRDQFPDRARAYDDFKEQQRNPRPAAVDTKAVADEQAVTSARAIYAKLEAVPAALARLQAKQAADPSLYHGADGLPQFLEDAAEAIAEERIAARTAKEAPARARLEERQANTAERRVTPRPDVSTGQRASTPLTDNVDELLAQGFAEVFRGDRGGKVAVR